MNKAATPVNATVEPTFRDYGVLDNTLSVNTDGSMSVYNGQPSVVLIQGWDTPEGELAQRVEFTRDQARFLGMRLIAWVGDGWAFSLSAQHTFKGVVGSLCVDVVDGQATVHVGDGPEHGGPDFALSADDAHDIGIRLLAWAGPKL